ncbi:hypothetical protein RB594_000329 [Gaeumannomyces avenae]
MLSPAVHGANAVCTELNSLSPTPSATAANEPPSSEAATILLEPEKAVVVGLLRDASILHFAGHGQSDTYDPLKSALLLRDWRETPFTVADVIDEFRRHERPHFLACLSACLTGSSHAKKLSDEGLHLMSAFQLAGFQHVIGSLWEVCRTATASASPAASTPSSPGAASARTGPWSAACATACGACKRQRDDAVSGAAGAAASTRDGQSISDRAARRKLWYGGDPRGWAAYIHMGP